MSLKIIITLCLLVSLRAYSNPCNIEYDSKTYSLLANLLQRSLEKETLVVNGKIALKASKYNLEIFEDARIASGEIPDNLNKGLKTIFTLSGGTLIFNLNLKTKTSRSTELLGREAFRLAIKHFGTKLLTINTLWSYGDNLSELNRLTKNMSQPFKISDIVKQTWSGRQAVMHGFSDVYKVELIGKPGNYKYASFDFYRSQE